MGTPFVMSNRDFDDGNGDSSACSNKTPNATITVQKINKWNQQSLISFRSVLRDGDDDAETNLNMLEDAMIFIGVVFAIRLTLGIIG